MSRSACAIEFPDALILTGGEKTRSKVSVYNLGDVSPGYLSDLPDLQVGRQDHGCGHYVNGNGLKVKDLIYMLYVCKRLYQNLTSGLTCNWRLR